jgi:hypothetical protein
LVCCAVQQLEQEQQEFSQQQQQQQAQLPAALQGPTAALQAAWSRCCG